MLVVRIPPSEAGLTASAGLMLVVAAIGVGLMSAALVADKRAGHDNGDVIGLVGIFATSIAMLLVIRYVPRLFSPGHVKVEAWGLSDLAQAGWAGRCVPAARVRLIPSSAATRGVWGLSAGLVSLVDVLQQRCAECSLDREEYR